MKLILNFDDLVAGCSNSIKLRLHRTLVLQESFAACAWQKLCALCASLRPLRPNSVRERKVRAKDADALTMVFAHAIQSPQTKKLQR